MFLAQCNEVASSGIFVSRKYILLLTLLVALPLCALVALSWRLAVTEQVRTQQQFEELLKANLVELDRDIAEYFDALEDDLLEISFDAATPDDIRETIRSSPFIDQVVILNNEGQIVYPNIDTLSSQESRYLLKIEPILTDRDFFPTHKNPIAQNTREVTQANVPLKDPRTQSQVYYSDNDVANLLEHGWSAWYWGNGIQLIHWRHLPQGNTILIGIHRARWIADVIAELPSSSHEDTATGTAPILIRLVDSDADVIYQWGASPGVQGKRPLTSYHLSRPLKPWQLQHFGPVNPIRIGDATVRVSLLLGGAFVALGVLGLAVILGREIGRETREARERVNFVNQVSHELKTPLTNIRMYAELVAQDLERMEFVDERASTHVAVITRESSRLSRLINNVLTFAGRNRANSNDRKQHASVDEVIAGVLAQFQPSLENLGMEVVCDLDAAQEVLVDVDALEQVLGNLISNAEKYATDGKHLRIRSRYQHGVTRIDVADAGPGVPHHFAKHLFEPFKRASDHIRSATGTGIGLAISRSLARKLGGDLELLESSIGATFRLTLPTPLIEESS